MMHLHENLKDEAFRIINIQGTRDDVKAGNDLEQINYVMTNLYISSEFVQKGIQLHNRLQFEYPEIQLLCDAGNMMAKSQGTCTQSTYTTPQEDVKSILTTDCFGILSGVLVKHHIVSELKEFIKSVD